MQLKSVLPRLIAVVAVVISGLAAATPAVQAAAPAYYPSGIQQDVPISTITGGGWQLCFQDHYGDIETLTDIVNACDGDFVLLAAGSVGAETYTLAAAGERSAVFGITGRNETNLSNGTYFYFNPSQSMGFSPSATITQNSADTYNVGSGDGDLRMSWHLDHCYNWDSPCVPDGEIGYLNGGWRVGNTNWLNTGDTGSLDYVRAIYTKSVPRTPYIIVEARNVDVTQGQPVPSAYRVSGLRGSDTVTDVVLEYSGTDIWGGSYAASTTPPTKPGMYSVDVKSYKLTAANASMYDQAKLSGRLTINWAPLPITDDSLKGSNAGTSSGATVAYQGTHASATGADWNVKVTGGTVAVAGGYLIVAPGSQLIVTGTGFRKLSPVRIYLMADGTELGSVYTDAQGSFSKQVSVSGTAAGSYVLQVNGYTTAGAVRTADFALNVNTMRSISKSARFNVRSAELKASIEARIRELVGVVPTSPWIVQILVTGTAADNGAALTLASRRVDAVAERIRALLAEAGVSAGVQTAVWVDPSVSKLALRTVSIDMLW